VRGERKKGKEKGLTSGPHVAVTEKKEKGERGRCWAAAAELGQKRKLGRGRKEAAWAWFCFFFKSFSNLSQTLFKFKPLNKFSQTFLNYF
jgi:hypothetical protein